MSTIQQSLIGEKEALPDASRPAMMNVQVSRVPPVEKKAKTIYPYKPLKHRKETYRGYPINGVDALKGQRWKVQIVSSACGAPPEPLPQFPQQGPITRTREGYVGCPGRVLNDRETRNNNGEAYLTATDPPPTSDYFFTAGFEPGSTMKLQKPFPESIYKYIVSGQGVSVKVRKSS